MSRLLLIDGNSILNRAFYGIMGSKMLTTKDGTYTNAVYGFLAIMFKAQEDLSPDHMAVTFDLKAPTARHKMYEGYKANRKRKEGLGNDKNNRFGNNKKQKKRCVLRQRHTFSFVFYCFRTESFFIFFESLFLHQLD